MSETGISLVLISALPQELKPLVNGWRRVSLGFENRQIDGFRNGDVLAVSGGIGMDRAGRVTKVLIETFCPEMVTSIGFAGSLVPSLAIGDIFVPGSVVNTDVDQRFDTAFGTGTLVSVSKVAGAEAKRNLVRRFGATCVDMEAAGVAQASHSAGVRFSAVKVVSDAPCDAVDFAEPFLGTEGFRTGAFLAHIAVRPWLWRGVGRLAQNSAVAGRSLKEAVQQLIADPNSFASRYSAEIRIKV
jgi:nucleoside phosphorylase